MMDLGCPAVYISTLMRMADISNAAMLDTAKSATAKPLPVHHAQAP